MSRLLLLGLLLLASLVHATPDTTEWPTINQDPSLDLSMPAPAPVQSPPTTDTLPKDAPPTLATSQRRGFFANLINGSLLLLGAAGLYVFYRRLNRHRKA